MKIDFDIGALGLGIIFLIGYAISGFASLGSVDRDRRVAMKNQAVLNDLLACGWSRPTDARASVGVALAEKGVEVKPITVAVEDGWGIRLGQAQWDLTPDGPRLRWCETHTHRWERQ